MSTPPGSAARGIDTDAVAKLARERLDWRHQAVPARFHGWTAERFASAGLRLSDLQTPLLTLAEDALTHNVATMASWCAAHGVALAPHGKTTMAPALWQRQLDAGAWGLTLAHPAQLRVARHFGVSTLLLANGLADPQAIRWVAAEVATSARIISWVDSVPAVERLQQVLADAGAGPLEVLVELGGPGGRGGARSSVDAVEVARAAADAPLVLLRGVGGYEAALAHGSGPADLDAVRRYLTDFRALHEALRAEQLYAPGQVILTAGGSAYFDDVVDALGPAGNDDVLVVLRSGAYAIHDDGFYRGVSPLARRGSADSPFVSAMHGWARVVSRTEPGLAILDAGKRDLPMDEGLPVPQGIAAELGGELRPLPGARITRLNDQHAFMTYPANLEVEHGAVVRLGLSHPCTAMDRWTLIPVIATARGESDPLVVGTVRTFF